MINTQSQHFLTADYYLSLCIQVIQHDPEDIYQTIEMFAVLRHLLHCWQHHDDKDALLICEQEGIHEDC